jgi:ribose 5-phosphate isomerase B
MAMRISIGSDHRGFNLKSKIRDFLGESGHEAVDLGTNSTESCDYPDIAMAVATWFVGLALEWQSPPTNLIEFAPPPAMMK